MPGAGLEVETDAPGVVAPVGLEGRARDVGHETRQVVSAVSDGLSEAGARRNRAGGHSEDDMSVHAPVTVAVAVAVPDLKAGAVREAAQVGADSGFPLRHVLPEGEGMGYVGRQTEVGGV